MLVSLLCLWPQCVRAWSSVCINTEVAVLACARAAGEPGEDTPALFAVGAFHAEHGGPLAVGAFHV